MSFLNIFDKTRSHNYGTFIEPFEGQAYKTIVIGEQEWMAENLNVGHYRDGTPIPNLQDNYSWDEIPQKHDIEDDEKCAWCYYENNEKYGKIYGKLYNWYAVNNPCGLAPKGWRIPSHKDWSELVSYIRDSELKEDCDSIKLLEKGRSHWRHSSRKVTNETGFTALPGGQRSYDGTFKDLKHYGYWWSTDHKVVDMFRANFRYITYKGPLKSDYLIRDFGLSVRCIKD